jgi:hypothetical protein
MADVATTRSDALNALQLLQDREQRAWIHVDAIADDLRESRTVVETVLNACGPFPTMSGLTEWAIPVVGQPLARGS